VDLSIVSRIVANEHGDGTLQLMVAGDLDLATAPALQSEVTGLLAAHDISAVEVDAAGLTSSDDIGLSVLTGLRRRVQRAGGSFRVEPADLLG
jgi:anti-anti-sigma factor